MPPEYSSNWAMATTMLLDERPEIGMVDGRKNAQDAIRMAHEFAGVSEGCVVTTMLDKAFKKISNGTNLILHSDQG